MPLKVRVADKPIQGVGTEDPEKYAEISEFMKQYVYDRTEGEGEQAVTVKGALDNDNKELEIEADSKTEAELYAGYARAWGKRQDPALEIRRIPARQGQPNTLVRLSVKTFDPDAPRPGRPNPATQAARNQAQAQAQAPAPETQAPAQAPAPETQAPAEAPAGKTQAKAK